MIKTEYPYSGDPRLVRTYSDEGKELLQTETGRVYDEAIDTYPCRFTYREMENGAEKEDVHAEITGMPE